MPALDYTFRFTPAGPGPPLDERVSRMLKYAGRTCHLKAVQPRPERKTRVSFNRAGSPSGSGTLWRW